jgi:hypothetical protein
MLSNVDMQVPFFRNRLSSFLLNFNMDSRQPKNLLTNLENL